MYISITNFDHKKTKYFIIDETEELNLPDIPSRYSLVFKEKYTNNIKVINDEELKKIFKNNTLFYEVIMFNSSFKISTEDIINIISNEFKFYLNIILKIKDNQCLNSLNKILYIKNNYFEFLQNDFYNKNDIDNLISNTQNKINEINDKIDIINIIKEKSDKSEISQILETMKNDLNSIKEKILT